MFKSHHCLKTDPLARLFIVLLVVMMALLTTPFATQAQGHTLTLPELTAEDAAWVGERIYANECNLNPACLTSWNAGEDFPSLGIGHFIWYREGQQERFQESFPALMAFYESEGVALPQWLNELPGRTSPWQTREQFQTEYDQPHMQQLREFFLQTREVQARFIIRRLHQAVPDIVAASDRPAEVEALFYKIANAHPRHGMYALIDYVNFKGEGTNPAERYEGEGWGLLQVLEAVLGMPDEMPLMLRFSEAAKQVLVRRIANSPPERGEERWERGWNNRADTYVP